MGDFRNFKDLTILAGRQRLKQGLLECSVGMVISTLR